MASRQILQRWARRAGEQLDGKMAHAPPGAHAHILKKGGWALRPVFPAAKNNESMCLLLMFYQVAKVHGRPKSTTGQHLQALPTSPAAQEKNYYRVNRSSSVGRPASAWRNCEAISNVISSLSLSVSLSLTLSEKNLRAEYISNSLSTHDHTPQLAARQSPPHRPAYEHILSIYPNRCERYPEVSRCPMSFCFRRNVNTACLSWPGGLSDFCLSICWISASRLLVEDRFAIWQGRSKCVRKQQPTLQKTTHQKWGRVGWVAYCGNSALRLLQVSHVSHVSWFPLILWALVPFDLMGLGRHGTGGDRALSLLAAAAQLAQPSHCSMALGDRRRSAILYVSFCIGIVGTYLQ